MVAAIKLESVAAFVGIRKQCGDPPAEIRQTRMPVIDGSYGGDNGKQVISDIRRWLGYLAQNGPTPCATTPVGMG